MKSLLPLPCALLVLIAATRALAQQPAAPAPGAAEPAGAAASIAVPAAPAGATLSGGAAAGTATLDRDPSGLDTLTVDFPDREIREIVGSVADLFDLNVIVPETLQGRATVKLRGVTWRQIYDAVLDPVGFTYVQQGNIIKIISRESLQMEPTQIEPFPLNYAKAADVKPILDQLVDPAAGGKIMVDARTNMLVITERPSRMDRIRSLILSLDKPTDQVMIEAKFIEVTDGDIKNLGINWSTLKAYKAGATPTGNSSRTRGQDFSEGVNSSNGTNASNTTTTTGTQTLSSGTGAGTTATISNTVESSINNGITDVVDFVSALSNTGATARAVSAIFTADQFGFVISALSELSRTRVISNPTIVTVNNKMAKINVGEENPIPNFAFNEQRGTFEVSGFDFRTIGITLEVTPQVNARGLINLHIKPNVSQQNGSVNFGGAGGAEIPKIATRNAETNVSLRDGETLGIGGLLTSQSTNSGNKVPLLGNVPILGGLFRNKSTNESSTNLLIFVTAKSLSAEGAKVGEVFDPRQVRASGLLETDLPGFRDGSSPFVQPVAPMAPPQSIK